MESKQLFTVEAMKDLVQSCDCKHMTALKQLQRIVDSFSYENITYNVENKTTSNNNFNFSLQTSTLDTCIEHLKKLNYKHHRISYDYLDISPYILQKNPIKYNSITYIRDTSFAIFPKYVLEKPNSLCYLNTILFKHSENVFSKDNYTFKNVLFDEDIFLSTTLNNGAKVYLSFKNCDNNILDMISAPYASIVFDDTTKLYYICEKTNTYVHNIFLRILKDGILTPLACFIYNDKLICDPLKYVLYRLLNAKTLPICFIYAQCDLQAESDFEYFKPSVPLTAHVLTNFFNSILLFESILS